MRVLQLIDSLHPGGAERMAITLANELVPHIEKSYLCVTREEGILKSGLSKEVHFTFLNKKNTLDFKALIKLKKLVKAEQINIVHAHSTSYFFATIIKLNSPKVKLIWHDHYGDSEKVNIRKHLILKYCSNFFDGTIAVNEILLKWNKEKLRAKKLLFLKNFVTQKKTETKDKFRLKGNATFKILCVANVRPQKDHLNLIKAFVKIRLKFQDSSLHLIGNNEGEYAKSIYEYINLNKINDIFFYGSRNTNKIIYNQASVGVLSSISEGLPISLLEYGAAGLAVVTTNVGQCAEVVGDTGQVVSVNNPEALAAGILKYIENDNLRKIDAEKFKNKIEKEYSAQAVLPQLMSFYKTL